MKVKKMTIAIVTILVSLKVFGAEIAMIKGEATILLPGNRLASPVTIHMKVPEESSILTKDNSAVRVNFDDGSTMMIGSKTKIVIEKFKTPTSPAYIQMLIGKIRAQVNKGEANERERVKMVIKSGRAALGVRGTDFMIAFDPETEASSLITFEGKVAIVKNLNGIDVVKELLETHTLVKEGEFAGLNKDTYNKKLESVKISPQQLEGLRNNLENQDNHKAAGNEGQISKGTDKVIDLKTAQVISGDSGYINLQTGDFTPLKGLELTTKGFVPKNREDDENLKWATSFNKKISGEKFWESKITYWVDLYSLRTEFQNANSRIVLNDDSIIKHNIQYYTSDLNNAYYAKLGLFNVDYKSSGCSNCGNGIYSKINKSTYKEITLGYERRIDNLKNIFLELGGFDRASLEGNQVDKKLSKRVSVGSKLKFLSSEQMYPYARGRVDLIKTGSSVGPGFELGFGIDKKINSKYSAFGEIFIGREKVGGNKSQTGGIGLGLSFGF
jgi:hypothetical protein